MSLLRSYKFASLTLLLIYRAYGAIKMKLQSSDMLMDNKHTAPTVLQKRAAEQ